MLLRLSLRKEGIVKNVFKMAINSYREAYNGCCYGEHAEMALLRWLKRRRPKKNNEQIDIIVIRVGGARNANSCPCEKCLKHISKLKGYIVKNIRYSDADGNLVCVPFIDLLHSNNAYKTYKQRNGVSYKNNKRII